jgi:hypothetical protein
MPITDLEAGDLFGRHRALLIFESWTNNAHPMLLLLGILESFNGLIVLLYLKKCYAQEKLSSVRLDFGVICL